MHPYLVETRTRLATFAQRLHEANIPVAIVTDESSIAYLAGFWGYLGIEFGRPTCLVVRPDAEPVIITPLLESEMVAAMTGVEDVRAWEDAGTNRWENVLANVLGQHPSAVGVETHLLPAIARVSGRALCGCAAARCRAASGRHAPHQIAAGDRYHAPGGRHCRRHDARGAGIAGGGAAGIRGGTCDHGGRHTQSRGLTHRSRLGSFRLAAYPQSADYAERAAYSHGASPRQRKAAGTRRPGIFLLLQYPAVQALPAGFRPPVFRGPRQRRSGPCRRPRFARSRRRWRPYVRV